MAAAAAAAARDVGLFPSERLIRVSRLGKNCSTFSQWILTSKYVCAAESKTISLSTISLPLSPPIRKMPSWTGAGMAVGRRPTKCRSVGRGGVLNEVYASCVSV